MTTYIEEICEQVPWVDPKTQSQEVHLIFKDNPKLQGIVVIEEDRPVALVMRSRFYQKIGGLYGYNLYMGRAIELVMNKFPFIVDCTQPIVDVSQKAMERPEEDLYDYVIVTKEDKYIGVVSIQKLLLTFADIQKEAARFLNPLTGLPGNNLIDLELSKLINLDHFCVLYIDLDNFKAYNDTYGFKNGDKLILETARILQSSLPHHFVGHIGGDDFVGILKQEEYTELANQIIHDFDLAIQQFYSEEHLDQNYVITENRFGIKEKIPLVSISIAIVTNQGHSYSSSHEIVNAATEMKKICKKNNYSCFVANNYNCI